MARVPQGMSAQMLSNILHLPFIESSFFFIWVVFCDWGAIGKGVIFIGLLWVGIRTNLTTKHRSRLFMYSRISSEER